MTPLEVRNMTQPSLYCSGIWHTNIACTYLLKANRFKAQPHVNRLILKDYFDIRGFSLWE